MNTSEKWIRIVGLPPGEAPIEIRQAWIGLELPLAHGRFQAERTVRSLGVLTAPRSFFGILAAWIFRRGELTNVFVVESVKALEILQAERPNAAEWWKQNAGQFFEQGHLFGFASESCVEFRYDDR